MDRDIDVFVTHCSVCAKADKTMTMHHWPMTSVELPEGPWIKVSIDFIGPMNALSLEIRYAIVLIDYFSKWVEVKCVFQLTMREVVDFLKELFCRGFPHQFVTNNGVQFVSPELVSSLKKIA